MVYSSPATAAIPAMWQRWRRGTPYVLLIQDLWPDSIFSSGFLTRPLIRRVTAPIVATMARSSYRQASHLAVISPGMVEKLVQRGVPRDKITLIYNWVDEELFSPRPATGALRDRLGLGIGDFVLLYAGNHGAAQALSPIVQTFTSGNVPLGVHLVLVGDGIEKQRLRVLAQGAGNVHFLDPVPQHEVGELMADSDAQLVSLAGDALFEITMPSKVQAAMAAGRPVLCSAPGDAARVIEDTGAGLSCAPGDPSKFAATLKNLAATSREDRQAMGDMAAEHYRREMSRAVGAARLRNLLAHAANSRSARPRRLHQKVGK